MNKINYNKLNVTLYFTGGILFYVLPIVLLLLNATIFHFFDTQIFTNHNLKVNTNQRLNL